MKKIVAMLLLFSFPVYAARDNAGNYALPAGNPVTAHALITSSWANLTMADVATALTDSLSRSGKGGMLSPFGLQDGSAATPGLNFTLEPTSGLYRASAGKECFSVSGTQIFCWTSAGLFIPAFTAAGVVTNTSAGQLGTLPGTTTTVLHGNAAGLPTFAAVSLTADVSGILPAANGGTGTTGPIPISLGGTGVATAATPGAVHVGLTSTTLGYTATGTSSQVLHGNGAGVPTFGAVALGSEVSGTLPQGNGGTGAGALTCSAGQHLTSNGSAYSCSSDSVVPVSVTLANINTGWDGGGAVVSGTKCDLVSFAASGFLTNRPCVLAGGTYSFANAGCLSYPKCVLTGSNVAWIEVCNMCSANASVGAGSVIVTQY